MTALPRNSTEKVTLPSQRTVHVPKCERKFTEWNGNYKGVLTYGGKKLLKFRNKPLYAELLVLRVLQREGWDGVWVDSYGGRYRNGMPHEADPIELPARQNALLQKIRSKAGCRGGCFDVFVWRGNRYRFVELKRSGKDRIRETQKRWIEAARRCGVKMSQLMVVEWEPE